MKQFINKIRLFALSGRMFKKLNIAVVFCIVFFVVIVVKAATPYSADISNLDTSAYPMVRFNIDLSKYPNGVTNLTGRNFSIFENEIKNTNPIVVLPPGAYNNKIDLIILLDRSGNTKNYEQIIKTNLKALVRYLTDKKADLNIRFASFSSSTSSYGHTLKNYSDLYSNNNFNNDIDALAFDEARTEKAYGLEGITTLMGENFREGADKVALIINGSQYYEKAEYTLMSTRNMLENNNFQVFVAGFPIKQMLKHKTSNPYTYDMSFAHYITGGYLGSFSSDLTAIYDLLVKKNSTKYTIQYFAGIPTADSSIKSVKLNIDDINVSQFNYPVANLTQPDITHNPQPAPLNAPYNVKIQINNTGKYINVVELAYQNANGTRASIFMEHRKSQDTAGLLFYEGEIPAKDIVKGNLIYYFILHMPFDTLRLGANPPYVVEVLEYDPNIILKAVLAPSKKDVNWSWSVPKNYEVIKYELSQGDSDKKELFENRYTIPLGECNLYQIVKVRAYLKKDSTHPEDYWSLPSLPVEYDGAPQTSVTEKDAIQAMFKCLKNKTAKSFDDFVSNENGYYKPDSVMYLNKMLEYITGIADSSLRSGTSQGTTFKQYDYIYYFMNFINSDEMHDYSKINNRIPFRLVYKMITSVNQEKDFNTAYNVAETEVINWAEGNEQ